MSDQLCKKKMAHRLGNSECGETQDHTFHTAKSSMFYHEFEPAARPTGEAGAEVARVAGVIAEALHNTGPLYGKPVAKSGEATPEGQQKIDISNLRFYAKMAQEFKWQTDIIHFGVIVQTLTEIADRLAERVSSPPAVNYLREVLPRPDDPSCHVCGTMMTPSGYKCASCGATTGVSSPRSAEVERKRVMWGIENLLSEWCDSWNRLDQTEEQRRAWQKKLYKQTNDLFERLGDFEEWIAALPGQPSPAPVKRKMRASPLDDIHDECPDCRGTCSPVETGPSRPSEGPPPNFCKPNSILKRVMWCDTHDCLYPHEEKS